MSSQSDDPPFLCLGTEVSAKFKGAFCEAKVKKLVKSIRCKVNLGSEHGIVVVEDKDIRGTIILNGNVDVVQGKHLRAGTIQHIKDCSQYTVVFNDGDERNLRRTQVCLKSGRHYEPEVSLDSLPLYNPEHFSSSVVHGNKKRNRQLSVERTPRKRRAKDGDDDEEEEEVDMRKKRRAASVAVVAMADRGSTESGDERDESGEESDREQRDKSEKKKRVEKVPTPAGTPAKRRKEEEEERKKEKKEEEKRKKEKEKEKEEMKKKEKKEEEKREKEAKKEEKRSKADEKAEKAKKESPSKREKERDKPESSSASILRDRAEEEEEIRKPGTTVVVAVHKESGTIYYPAITADVNAYKKYAAQPLRLPNEQQLIVKSLCSDSYVRINIANGFLFDSFNHADFRSEKMGNKTRSAITAAGTWQKKRKLPKSWHLHELFGDEELKKMEKEERKQQREEEKKKDKDDEAEKEKEKDEKKKKKEEEKKKRDEEKKREEEEEEERKEKEKEKAKKEKEKEKKEKEKEKEKEKKAKKQAEPESSASESESSEDDEAENQKRDIFIAQLYKFHEERNTPINKAPIWGGKDLDLHKLYRYVNRYGGSKKCTDGQLWKRILIKLKLDGTGAQAVNVKKAYFRYLSEFQSTYSQLGWSLDDLSTKIVTADRSAKKIIDYGFHKKRRQRKDKGVPRTGDKDESIRSGETAENDDDRESTVKKEEEESTLRAFDGSSTETPHSRRSLSRNTHSESPMPSTSTAKPYAAATRPAKKARKEQSVARTMSECTEPALTPAFPGGEDALSTVSSSTGAARASSTTAYASLALSPQPSLHELFSGTWAHDEADDNYMPANIITHFYQGMSVRARALHSGLWYAARVVQVHQPPIKAVAEAIQRAAGGKTKPEPGESFSLTSLDELREMTKKIRCLVHYLGWNSRYDEYMRLPQIRISEKDDEASMKLARPRLNENLLDNVAKWSRTRDGMSALCGPLEPPTPRDSAGLGGMMGGYRPRRVSFSHYDQLSASGASPMMGGDATSPSMSERERREGRSDEVMSERRKSEEKEEEEEEEKKKEQQEEEEETPVVEKRERKKSVRKDEKEKKEEVKEEREEEVAKEERKEEKVVVEKTEKADDGKPKRSGRVPSRTPSPSKVLSASAPSSKVEAAATALPAAAPTPVAAAPAAPVAAAAAAAAAGPSSSSAAVVAAAPATPAPPPPPPPAAPPVEQPAKKSGCTISDTIDEVVQLLGSRAEKEKREREERERREWAEFERARREQEAVKALFAKVAEEQREEEAAAAAAAAVAASQPGPSRQHYDAAAAVERRNSEDKWKKEVRFEKAAERKRGGRDREMDAEAKRPRKTPKPPVDKKKTAVKRVETRKEEEEKEKEREEAAAEDAEEATFVKLREEARELGIVVPDLPGEASPGAEGEREERKEEEEGEKAASPADNEERYQSDSSSKTTITTTIDKSAPPSTTNKGKKRKKKGGNQSNMVLDRKYSKKAKKDEEEESDGEEAIMAERPAHASLSILKSRMLKAMEADGSVRDFTPIGLPHITHSNLYGEKVVCNHELMEKHTEELKEYYYGLRAQLAKLEKRNKATIKRRIEKERAIREERRAAREAEAAAAAAAAEAVAAAAVPAAAAELAAEI